ncbi:MAG: hypothetical protein IKU19_05355, partial [Clostridia bacterium]|nr:hypothetical protein [Clostridia bacterium]
LPVVIDPILILTKRGGTTNNDIDTQYYSPGGGWRPATGNMYLGYDSSGELGYTGYFKVNNLPILQSNSVLVAAQICLGQRVYGGTLSSFIVSAHEATANPWCDASVNEVYYNPEALDYTILSAGTTTITNCYWDVTTAAQDWYADPTTNLGIVLWLATPMTPTSCSKAEFVGYNNAGYGSNVQPAFIVYYRNTVGVEGYYSYLTQNVGNAGTGYVRVNDAAFTLEKPILSNSGTAQSFILSTIYNNAYSAVPFDANDSPDKPIINTKSYDQMLVGRGWKLNVQQTIVEDEVTDLDGSLIEYLIHTDADGTEHYYSDDPDDETNDFVDEDGLKLSIEIHETEPKYTLKDDKDNKRIFYNGYLHQIMDASGNVITIKYGNSDNGNNIVGDGYPSEECNRIVCITQEIGGNDVEKTIATFEYNSYGQLVTVNDEFDRSTTFYYGANDSSGGIYQITHHDNTYVKYSYGGPNFRMSRAYDGQSQYGVNYEYTTAGEVLSFQEFASPLSGIGLGEAYGYYLGRKYYIGTSGKRVTYVRYHGQDRDSGTVDDIVTAYIFNNFGSTVNTITANSIPSDTNTNYKVYGTTVAEYTSKGDTPKRTDNKIEALAATGSLAVNYLQNPGIEDALYGIWKRSDTSGSIY